MSRPDLWEPAVVVQFQSTRILEHLRAVDLVLVTVSGDALSCSFHLGIGLFLPENLGEDAKDEKS